MGDGGCLLLASFFYGHAVAYVSHEQFETVPWHAMRVLAPMVVLFHVAVAGLVLFSVVGHAVIACSTVAPPKTSATA